MDKRLDTVVVLASDRGSRERARRALRRSGLEVRCAGSVLRALRIVADGSCAAFVVDLDAEGIDGLGVVSAVRGHEPTRALPIVALSRGADEATAGLLHGSGCDVVLAGPDASKALATSVELLLSRTLLTAA